MNFKDPRKIDIDENTQVKVDVKPKLDLKETIKTMRPQIKECQVGLTFNKTFEEDNVEIQVKVNGELVSIFNSPSGEKEMSASFKATKRF